MYWWWLSFCDSEKPPGAQFLGVAIVLAPNFFAAVHKAQMLGLNPGGEINGSRLTTTQTPDKKYQHRLLPLEVVRKLGLLEMEN